MLARLRVTRTDLETVPLAGEGGLVRAWIPSRTSLVFTGDSGRGVPYLRAHDALERIPAFDRYVLLDSMTDGDNLVLKEGWIVLTCSGRNFGPCAYVGERLAKAAMTDIMRLEPKDERSGLYVLAFLTSATGQTLIRRDPAGSVINHLAAKDLENIPVPLVANAVKTKIVGAIRRATELSNEAIAGLLGVDDELRDELGLSAAEAITWPTLTPSARVATQRADELGGRLDAEFHADRHGQARATVAGCRHERLDAVATLQIRGRYRRYYVEPPNGTPILSGGQLHQFRPVALKNISDRSFTEPERFRLKRGWSLLACDGRSEGDLGRAGYVSSLWEDWMASNHVMRVIPKADIDPGYLHAALRMQEVQVQLKSVATGSVVDALDETTSAAVLVPRLDPNREQKLGAHVDRAYEMWAEAYRLQSAAGELLDAEVETAYQGHASE